MQRSTSPSPARCRPRARRQLPRSRSKSRRARFSSWSSCSSPEARFAWGRDESSRPSGGVLHALGKRLQDGLFRAPREGDPAVRAAPDVLAADGRPRLLVEDRAADLGHLPGAEVLHQLERRAGVGHVVGDQHLEIGEVDQVGDGRQDHRHVETLVDPGIELDVHRERVLDAEGVADRAGNQQPAARDAEHDVGRPAVVGDRLRELARPGAEFVPSHLLPCHRVSLSSAAVSASTASAMSSELDSSSGWWETPPFSERTKSIELFGTNIASCPAPETTRGASGRTAANASPIATGSDLHCTSKPISAISAASSLASAERASTETVTFSGTTFVAFGSTSMAPTVATVPSRAHSRTCRTNAAASTSASARASIGVVPAWSARPSKTRKPRAWPAIAVTTPSGSPSEASTGPCSMCNSRYASGVDSIRLLPIGPVSSARNATTASGRPRSRDAASIAATTPRAPSKRPAVGTLSRCDPAQTRASPRLPKRLPAPSRVTASPASRIQPAASSCAASSSGEYAARCCAIA